MATITAPPAASAPPVQLPGRRYDHYFFSAAAVLMFLTVFAGFARSYFLAGVFRATLPSLVVHIHGAAFTLWMLLLITQTSLVAAGRTDIHRRLGLVGFALGCLMIPLGVAVTTNLLLRYASGVDQFGRDSKAFYIIPLMDLAIFTTLLFAAFRNRRDSPAHKRCIYLATTALMVAPLARLPIAFMHRNNRVDSLVSDVFLLLLITYDYWSTRKIHRLTLWAGAFLVFAQQIRYPIGRTAAWHSFADWVIHLAR